MIPANQKKLEIRVVRAAEIALEAQNYVRPIDVLVGLGWLAPEAEKRWRQGRTDYLEGAVQANLNKISDAMKLFRRWANAKGLLPRESHYVSQTRDRRTLRFSISGDPSIEQAYSTHWISPALSEKKRARLAEKTDRPPELVVVMPLKPDWKCHRCGGTGALLVMEDPGPACLRCVGMDDLEFVQSGDALLTRRLKAKSARGAVVVRFSRSRKRYERQGILVEPQILAEVQEQLAKDRGGAEQCD
ncbi:MAG TPA: hypothetical protein VGY99_08345 [Candidatus Binataceae bacterium]|jgi:hypothetical protein|nr:hypothetical protein [Candidatus Binataceae bacterium]